MLAISKEPLNLPWCSSVRQSHARDRAMTAGGAGGEYPRRIFFEADLTQFLKLSSHGALKNVSRHRRCASEKQEQVRLQGEELHHPLACLRSGGWRPPAARPDLRRRCATSKQGLPMVDVCMTVVVVVVR